MTASVRATSSSSDAALQASCSATSSSRTHDRRTTRFSWLVSQGWCTTSSGWRNAQAGWARASTKGTSDTPEASVPGLTVEISVLVRVSSIAVPPRLSEGPRSGRADAARIASAASCLVLGILGFAADGDALGPVLSLGGSRQGHGEHAVVKRRLGLVLLDRKGQRDHPLEAAVVALAEPALLVLRFGPLLAPDGQDVVVHEHFDILLVQAGQFSRDPHVLVGLDHFDAGPRRHAVRQRSRAEGVEHVVKEPVHLAVEGQEGADLFTAPAGDGRLIATPGDQITKSHDVLHSLALSKHLQSRGHAPAGCLVSLSSG